jgi:hypothetical protein
VHFGADATETITSTQSNDEETDPMQSTTTTSTRWLRLKRHFRSFADSPRASRQADLAARGERDPRWRGLCRRTGGRHASGLAR